MAVEAVSMYAPGLGGYGGVPEDDLERRRMEARRRLAEALKPQNIQHPTQGLAQMANAGLAAWDDKSAGEEAKKNRAALADSIAKMWGTYGGGGGGYPGGGMPPAAAAPATPAAPPPVAEAAPIDLGVARNFGMADASQPGFDPNAGQPTEYPAPPPPQAPMGLADAGEQMRQQPAPAGPTPLTAEMSRILARDSGPPPPQPAPQLPTAQPAPMVAEAPPAPPQAAGRPSGMMKLGAELPNAFGPEQQGVVTSVPPPDTAAPPKPVSGLDRAKFNEELQNPAVRQRLLALTHAEVGGMPPEAAQALQETIFNRAAARGQSLWNTMQRDYYEPLRTGAYGRAEAALGRNPQLATNYGGTLDKVLGGSNVANYATGNASGSVGFNGGPQVARYGGERFGVEGPDRKWAASVQASQPQQTAALPPQQPPTGEQPKASGLIQMAQSGNGMTPELFRQIAIQNPQLAQQLLMQEIQTRRAEPDKALDREHKKLQIEAQRRSLDTGPGEIKVNPVTGEYFNNKGVIQGQGGGEDPQQAIYNKEFAKKAPELYQAAAKDHTAARELSRTLDDLKAIAPYAQTGFGAEQILTMRKAAAALGMSVDPKIAPTELFRALSQEGILNAAQKLKPLSNSDVAFVQKGLATMQSDPSSVPMITAGLGAIAKRSELAHELAMQQLKRGRQPDYVAIQNVVDEQLPSPIQAQFGGGQQGRQQAPRQQDASAPQQAPSPWDNVSFPGQSAPPQQQQAGGPSQTAASNVPQIKGDADYKALPSGTQYRDPQGNIRTKR